MKRQHDMKKWLLPLMTFVIVAVLTACAGGNASDPAEEGTSPVQTVSEDRTQEPADSPEDTPSDGDTIPEGTFLIYTPEDLLSYKAAVEEVMLENYERHDVHRGGIDAILMDDIDLTGICADGSFTPIGFFLEGNVMTYGQFVGCFDGNGHTISGLNINIEHGGHLGLFSYLFENSVVKNVTFDNCHISGRTSVGVLAGELRQGTVSNCTATSTVEVEGTWMVGGLVGQAMTLNDPPSLIENCTSDAVVSSVEGACGGIVGDIFELEEGATVVNCTDRASVSVIEE